MNIKAIIITICTVSFFQPFLVMPASAEEEKEKIVPIRKDEVSDGEIQEEGFYYIEIVDSTTGRTVRQISIFLPSGTKISFLQLSTVEIVFLT